MRFSSALVGLTLFLGLFHTSEARADVIERVVAVVNDDAIFLSDLRRRAVQYLPQVMTAPSAEERQMRLDRLYNQLLEQMVDESLVSQAARKAQIRVSTDDVDHAIENVQRQSHLSGAQFWSAVREQGYSEAQYRDDVRRQLLRLRLINQRVRGRVTISEEDVRQAYDVEVRRARAQTTFVAADILVQVPDGLNATQIAALRHDAEALRATLTASNFDAAMAEYDGIDLGELHQGQLDPALEQALLDIEPGNITAPVQNAAGFHILLLRERGHTNVEIPEYSAVRDVIQRRMLEEQMGKQETQYLAELRRDAAVQKLL